MKLLEQNKFKCFSWKTADLELRRFRNDGAMCARVNNMLDDPLLKLLLVVSPCLNGFHALEGESRMTVGFVQRNRFYEQMQQANSNW